MTALYTPLSADIPSAPQLQTWVPIFARRSSDSAPQNNNITLVNDTQLLVPLVANVTYEMTAVIRYSTNATANLAVAWTTPGVMNYEAHVMPAGLTAFTLYDLNETSPLSVSGSTGIMRLTGLVFPLGASGNLQFRWGQATANVSNTFIKDRSYIKLVQVV